jgi:hypothetical protein
MADANVFETYDSVGIREDLLDVIYNITPTDTPFVSNVGSGSSKGTWHEWQQDSLEAPGDSSVAEAADAAILELTPTIRLGNATQINTKSFQISGSDMVADNAGRGVEMSYQEAKKGLELRKDIEWRCVDGTTGISDDPSADCGYDMGTGGGGKRQAASLLAWIASGEGAMTVGAEGVGNVNYNSAVGGANPVRDATNGPGQVGRTDGTVRTFTEGMLTDVIDQIYLSGGSPDVIMCNTQPKRIISQTFRGSADENKQDVSAKRIINAVDFYESDYGVLAVVPNRYMRQRDVYVLDTDMYAVDYYRPFFSKDLPDNGDYQSKQMLVEWTLKSDEQLSSGGIFDITNV